MKSLFLLLLANLSVAGDTPPWRELAHAPSLALEDWQAYTGFRAYPDFATGRVLLERKGAPPLILLIDTPYALRGERFLALPTAPRRVGSKVYLGAEAADRLFRPALEGEAAERFSGLVASAPVPKPVAPPPAPKVAVPAPVPVATPTPVAKAPPVPADANALPVNAACPGGRPVHRIFLDPGHGGDDAGTRHGHVSEKDVVLRFARLAAEELKRRGFAVSFSRTRDVFLPLDIRTKLAEQEKADLFVSLHVNSSPATSVHGTETYILSPDATDAAARKLALLENSVVNEAKASAGAVQDILWDMEQTAYLQDSAYLASYLQGAIVANAHDLLSQQKAGDWKNRGVRQAPFYVLNRAPMPAVLVELGYLSNERDRKLLSDKLFQESLAKALAEGVRKYKEACRSQP